MPKCPLTSSGISLPVAQTGSPATYVHDSLSQSKLVTSPIKGGDCPANVLRVTIVPHAVRPRLGVVLRLPADGDLRVPQEAVGPVPRVYQEPVVVAAHLRPRGAVRAQLLDRREGALEPQVVARVGADEGSIDDGASRVRGGWLGDDVAVILADRRPVVHDARDEVEGIGAVVRRRGAGRGRAGGRGREVVQVAEREVDVGVQLVRPVERAGALVPLNGVLLLSGDVVSVRVGRASDHDEWLGVGRVCRSGLGLDGVAPAAAGHGGRLGGRDDDVELACAEGLHVDDIRGPVVGLGLLTDIQKDRLWRLALYLLGPGGLEQGGDGTPDRVVGRTRVTLGEVKRAWPVRRSGREGIAKSSRTGLGSSAVGELEVEGAHVLVEMERLDGSSDDRRRLGIKRIVQILCTLKLTSTNLVAGRHAEVESFEPGTTTHVRRGVSNVGLGKASDKTIGHSTAGLHGLLKQIGGHALVVSSHVGVVSIHGGPMDGVPGKYAHIQAIRCALEAEHGQCRVRGAVIEGAFRSWVIVIGRRASGRIAVGNVDGTDIQVASGEAFRLGVKPSAGDLRKQVVPPSARPIVGVSSGHGNVGPAVDRIVPAESGDAFKDGISLGRVTGCHVQDEIDEAVVGAACVTDNEGTRIEALTETSTDLGQVRISSKLYLDDRPSDISLAHSDAVYWSPTAEALTLEVSSFLTSCGSSRSTCPSSSKLAAGYLGF
ncbi:hypothetical protein FJTKL_11299 [Diaporthe vaccinii]|uniref:Uncharacterized protein n=1 Tax=Diaporthe vaccinii TaxID=105482 RepID=A0ABR4EHF1_9PEZI